MLWEKINTINPNCGCVEIHTSPTKEDLERIHSRLDEADTIVSTNYYCHHAPVLMGLGVGRIAAFPAPEAGAVRLLATHGIAGLRVVAEILFGIKSPRGKLPVQLEVVK